MVILDIRFRKRPAVICRTVKEYGNAVFAAE